MERKKNNAKIKKTTDLEKGATGIIGMVLLAFSFTLMFSILSFAIQINTNDIIIKIIFPVVIIFITVMMTLYLIIIWKKIIELFRQQSKETKEK